jgi:hypothetical protein
MLFASRLRNRKPTPTRASAASFRPRLESLDDRLVPSTLKVTSPADSGPGTLRYELAHANGSGKDTITFDNRLGTINLTEQLNVTTGVTIKGPGAAALRITTNYNFGDPWGQSTRAFEVNASRPVVISGVSITDNGGSPEGAAVLNHSQLTLSGCDLSENEADRGGAVYNLGTLTLTDCTLKNDRGPAGGGAVYNAGTMTVTGCTFSFDTSLAPGVAGGAISNAGTLAVGTSTFVRDDIAGPYTDRGGNTFVTAAPQIGSVTATPGTVAAGGTVTLTVSGITDANPGAVISQVLVSVNSITFPPSGYSATQTSPGVWTFTFDTTGWAAGTYTLNAAAVDSYGVASSWASVTVQVV